MPAVKTLHKYLLGDFQKMRNDANGDINTLISNITFEILRDSPALVADVSNGAVERAVLETAIIKVIDGHKYHFGLNRDDLIRKVFDFMFGYGELQKYIQDDDITDIDGTRYDEFSIKKNGLRYRIPVNFGSEKIFDTYCKLVAVRNRGILNENDSHCRVTDEKNRLRINVSIKPRNISSPAISIRKHRLKSYCMDELKSAGMVNGELRHFFLRLAKTDATVIFCGKGAAGKTTLMRAFLNEFPQMERVLVAETDAELFPDKPYCIEQRVKKANEGGRPVTLKDLVRDGLTMSLDCYCIGEVVGDEAWEFIKAAFTGHRGLATLHSESAEDAFSRLLTLCKSGNAGETEKTIKEIMAKSIDVIVYLKAYKVVEILEVIDYDIPADKFLYNRLFKFEISAEDKNGFITGKANSLCGPGKRLEEKFGRRSDEDRN